MSSGDSGLAGGVSAGGGTGSGGTWGGLSTGWNAMRHSAPPNDPRSAKIDLGRNVVTSYPRLSTLVVDTMTALERVLSPSSGPPPCARAAGVVARVSRSRNWLIGPSGTNDIDTRLW